MNFPAGCDPDGVDMAAMIPAVSHMCHSDLCGVDCGAFTDHASCLAIAGCSYTGALPRVYYSRRPLCCGRG